MVVLGFSKTRPGTPTILSVRTIFIGRIPLFDFYAARKRKSAHVPSSLDVPNSVVDKIIVSSLLTLDPDFFNPRICRSST